LILSLPLINPDLFKVSIDLVGEDAEEKFRSLVLVLDEIRRTSEDNGIEVGLIYIPTRFQYEQGVFDLNHPWVKAGLARQQWLTEETEVQTRLGQWAMTHNLPFLDLTSRLRDESIRGKTLTFELDGHWNANGHLAAAAAIRDWIEEESFLGPEPN